MDDRGAGTVTEKKDRFELSQLMEEIAAHPLYDLALEEVVALVPSVARMSPTDAIRAPYVQQLMAICWLRGMDWQRIRFMQMLLKETVPPKG